MHCYYCGIPIGGITTRIAVYVACAGLRVCQSCVDIHFWTCGDCGEYVRLGEHCSCNVCDECGNYHDECTCGDESALIHDYSFKPRPQFHGKGPLFLGAEIEIECPRREVTQCAELATGHLGSLGYLKADSSINNGFEIVTHPMSFDWAMAEFPYRMFDELGDRGCEADENCGMHIHVSRDGFSSASHVYRWMKLIYRNAPEVQRIARRQSQQWAPFDRYARRAQRETCKGASGDRYQAINPQNAHTFELRVFASTLVPGEVRAAFGLAHASIEYTRTLSAKKISEERGWEWAAFTKWVGGIPAYSDLTTAIESASCAF